MLAVSAVWRTHAKGKESTSTIMLGHSSQSCSRAKAHAIAHAKLTQGELELDNWGNPLPNASEATKAYVAKTKEEMKAKELSNKSTYPQNADGVMPK